MMNEDCFNGGCSYRKLIHTKACPEKCLPLKWQENVEKKKKKSKVLEKMMGDIF